MPIKLLQLRAWISTRLVTIRRATVQHTTILLSFILLSYTSCATFNTPANTPVAYGTSPMAQLATPDRDGDTAVGLAFSGGGTRAAAFAYGVLRGLDQLPTTGGKRYLDRVVFVSGVSGGGRSLRLIFGLKAVQLLTTFVSAFDPQCGRGIEHCHQFEKCRARPKWWSERCKQISGLA
jgi:hypothetical protein